MKGFALSVHRWLFHIAPPSCVKGRQEPTSGPYVPFSRVPLESGDVDDEKAWRLLCNGGQNGLALFILCLAIWKGLRNDQFFGTHADYNSVLSDVKWILDEGIRIKEKL